MKKSTLRRLALGLSLFTSVSSVAQNPGLLISEFLQNPAGTDSPYEYVEFIVTDNIDFSTTPYTIVVSNNGTATANGWVEGGSISYAFEITTGTVSVGDVVYVGGSLMTPTGTKLRLIDTGTTNGDGGIGTFNTAGVIGNGGTNADGIAVFNLPVSSITNSTVPTDAVFYGTGIGGAEVNAGADGYQLPVNDLYNGGKLSSSSFYAVDEDLTIATGVYDQTNLTWITPRTFATGTATATSEITFGSASSPVDLSFDVADVTYDESDGTVTLQVIPNNTSLSDATAELLLVSMSNATNTLDFVLLDTVLTIPAGSSTAVNFSLQIIDDGIEEQSEYIVFTLGNLNNATISGNTSVAIYIADNDRMIPQADNELKLNLLTSFSNGAEGSNSAEIVAFDELSQKLFVANSVANNLDIVDFTNPAAPVLLQSINLDSIGAINSVAAYNGIAALAVQNLDPQMNGYVIFFDHNGNWVNRLTAGAMPDMVTFNHAKNKVLLANEGEPADDYSVDPVGSVSVVDLTPGFANLTQSDVTQIGFGSYDGQEVSLNAMGIRVFSPGATASQDFEPEYITILDDDSKAFVVLQENNAIAVLDMSSLTIVDLLPLGTIDHNLFGNGMDVSNQTSGINISNFPVHGMFMPDAISHISIGGVDYLLTANEGDSRDYSAYSEEARIKDVVLDPVAFPDAEFLQESSLLGRLLMTTSMGNTDGDGDFDEIYTFGTRSFSILNAATGALVFDSGDWFEQIIAADPVFAAMFNASNTSGGVSVKNRSDDKGPEPEGVTAVEIDGNAFAFVSLERVGGVMMFNINDPFQPKYIGYYNNRDVATNGPDRGAEGLLFIESAISPNGNSLLILANEISSTLSIYEVSSCVELSGLSVQTASGLTSFCDNDSLELTSTTNQAVTYQWLMNGSEIGGAISDSYFADMSGDYQLMIENPAEACLALTDTIKLNTLVSPAVIATLSQTTVCSGDSAMLIASGNALTYSWESGLIDGEYVDPSQDEYYTLTGTASNGCINIDSVMLTVNTLPTPLVSVSNGVLMTQTYVSYEWSFDGNAISGSNSNSYQPTQDGDYIVTVTDANGCENSSSVYSVNFTTVEDHHGVEFAMMPNPSNDFVNIVTNSKEEVTMRIFALNGSLVITKVFSGNHQLDLSNLAEGVYTVQFEYGTNLINSRLIIQN
ncbi:MAG: choice-of-anchor I family protein [Flavobacteriales bacterium]|nr:choice-of-anchor I family protein [Flavobacteriales bacterium]